MESSSAFMSLICFMTIISSVYPNYDVREYKHRSPLHQRRPQRTTEIGFCAYSPTRIGPRTYFISHLNPRLYSASHRSLPLNSLVNVDTGNNSITVRITDHRTKPGHVLDLSAKAAKSLHINKNTLVRCEITVMYQGGRRRNPLVRNSNCKPSWYGICNSPIQCCSGHCIHVRGGPGVCFPRNYHPSGISRFHSERTLNE